MISPNTTFIMTTNINDSFPKIGSLICGIETKNDWINFHIHNKYKNENINKS